MLTTDYILGFPSETKKESIESLFFIKESGINAGNIFPFACKSGAKAEKFEPKISNEEINSRLRYAKKFLKNAGYNIIYIPKINFFAFNKKNVEVDV